VRDQDRGSFLPANLQGGVGVESASDGTFITSATPRPHSFPRSTTDAPVGSRAGKAEARSCEELELNGNGPLVTPDDAGLEFSAIPRPEIHKAITLLRHQAGQPPRAL
jgi:hypothetical protein